MDEAPKTLTSGVVPGGYRLGRRLQEGSNAVVYEATHPRMPGPFVVKVLDRRLAGDARAIRAFRTDAETTAAMRHPHIVQIIDINQLVDGRPFVVMERLDGVDLEARLAGNAALPLRETVAIVRGIAAGLAAAHDQRVVHRDLRPANVFLASVVGHDSGFVKILNFGLSNLRSSSLIGDGNVHFMGDPHYMSPEQALGAAAEVDPRTDQFALGAITFRMLTGFEAFRGEDAFAVLNQIVHHPPRSLSMRSVCPPAVEVVISRAFAKRKDERFPDVLQFARALEDAATGRLYVGAPPAPLRQPTGEIPPEALVNERLLPPEPRIDTAGPMIALDDDIDERVFRPRRGPRLLLALMGLLLVAVAGVFAAGDRLPIAWRSHELWRKLRLPHAAPLPEVVQKQEAIATGGEPAPEPVSTALAAAPTDAGVDGGEPDAAALPVVEAEAAPEAPPEPEPETVVQAAEPPPESRRSQARARKRRARLPVRNYVWSETLQRLVPLTSDPERGVLP